MNYPVVVAFFGKQSFERLESMLQFFSKILHEQDWNSFLFVLCTPGNKTVASLSNDLPPYIRSRCHDGSGDPQNFIFRETANLIRNMYRNHLLHLHLICDDFLDPLYPEDAPANLTDVLRNAPLFLHVQPHYYFLLHTDDSQAIGRQRSLAQKVSRDPAAFPYLLSTTMDDHSLAQPETISRAMMCEILTISQGKRLLSPGVVSSLGYTSLNANEKELSTLRKQELIALLRSSCASDFSAKEAWGALLPGIAVLSDHPTSTREHSNVLKWLKKQIYKDVRKFSDRELSNFRILTDVAHQTSTNSLFRNAQRFYALNNPLTAQDDAPIEESPAFLSAKKHMDMLLDQLSRCLNLCNFPMDIFELLFSCLSSLCKYVPQNSDPAYPSAPPLSLLFSKNRYMIGCSKAAEEAAYHDAIDRLVPQYARAYGQMFSALKNRLAHAASITNLLQERTLTDYVSSRLIGKYPEYHSNIRDTLGMLQPHPFRNVRLYDVGSFSPSNQAMDDAIEQADRILHRQMATGFRTSFIDAIRTEFSTAEAMDTFLGHYLKNERMFLPDSLSLHAPLVSTYFCNMQLQNTIWANVHRARTFFVQNDNVERLDYFPLTNNSNYKLLSDFLNRQNNPQHFPYFLDQNIPVYFPNAPAVTFDPATALHENTDEPVSMPAVIEGTSPNLALQPQGNRYFLTWNWYNHPYYKVKINDRTELIARNQYSYHFEITHLLSTGMNHIFLMPLTQSQPLATLECYVPRKKIDYQRHHPGSLMINNDPDLPQALPKWAVVDKSQSPAIYYPLSLAALPASKPIRYDNLAFGGDDWELVVAPDKQFCCDYPPRKLASN